MIYFTSDLHFGHKNIIRFDNRPFNDIEEMNKVLIENWNKVVSNIDTIYILGDMFWYKTDTKHILQQLNGRKILIKGNHDDVKGIENYFEDIFNYLEIKYNHKTFILSHYPILIYNKQHSNGIMLYGHVHNSEEEIYIQEMKKYLTNKNIPCNMYNVGCMLNNYKPISIEKIIEELINRKER